jgi:3D (Asp-Asp-Asp) domain-containing protein
MPAGSVAEVIKYVYELSVVDKGTKKLLASEREVQKETRETARALKQQDMAHRRSAGVAEQASKREVRAARQVAAAQRRASDPGLLRRGAGAAAGRGRGVLGAAAGIVSVSAAKQAVGVTEALAKTTLGLHKSFGLIVQDASRWAAVTTARGVDGKQLTMGFKTLATQVRNATQAEGKQAEALDNLRKKNAVRITQAEEDASRMEDQSAARRKLQRVTEAVAASEDQLSRKTAPNLKLFERLGISQQELVKHGNDMNWVLRAVSDGLAKLPPGTDKTAISAKLFGRTWMSISPLIRDGSKAMEEQLGLADKYGATLGVKNVDQLSKLIAAQRESKLATLGLQVAFGTKVAPTLTNVINKTSEFAAQMRTGAGAGGQFAAKAKEIARDLRPVGEALKAVGGFFVDHPRLVVAAAGSYAAFKAARGTLRIVGDIRAIGSAISMVGGRAARTRLAVLLANGAKGTAARIGRILTPVGDVVASRMASAADRGSAALGANRKWSKAGGRAGRAFGLAAGAAVVLGLAAAWPSIQKWWERATKDLPGPDWLWSPNALGEALGFKSAAKTRGSVRRRTGGRITRMAMGGMVPILAAGGEVHVDGARATMIPGDPRRDSTLMFARPGSAVLTGDGQARMMAGASLGEAITHQAPHFAKGGRVPGGRYISTSYGPPWTGIQGTGVTATGVNLRRGPKVYGVAVDPRVIPLGAQLYANPNPFGRSGPFRAFDTGSAIKGNRIDFYDWRGRRKQNAWGRRSVRVSGVRIRGVGTGEAPEGDITARVPLTLGRSRSRSGLLQDAVEQGIAAAMAGLTRREVRGATRGARGARVNPIMEAIRGAMTPTVREVTIPGASGGGGAGAEGATPRLRKMNAFAKRASAKYPKYVYGGGHAGFSGPYDCSGFVSAILHAGNFLARPMTTDGFKSWGRKGDGARITVGVRGSTGRNAHMMMRVGSSYWEAGSSGVGRRGGWSGKFPIRRHPAGYRRGGLVGDMGMIPTRIAERLLDDPRALDPSSPTFVGYGLRRGGIVRRMARGGVVGGRLGSALHAATTFRGGSFDALDAAIGGAVEARLERLRREVLRRVRRGGDKKTVQRLQSIIDLVDFELGRRIGRYQDVVEQRAAAIDRAQAGMERGLRLAGVDAGSPLGTAVLARGQAAETTARAASVASLRRALEIAQRTGNQEVVRDVTQRYREAQDTLAESLVRQVELWRDQLRSLSDEVTARAQFTTGLAGAGGSILEAWQRTAGTQDTAAGIQQRATYAARVTLPALEQQRAAALFAAQMAAASGDVNGWRTAVQDAAGAAVEIANAQADAADLMRQAAMRAAQDVVDAAGHGRTMADLGLQRLELEQQLIGTHDTGGGAVGRADFIRRAIIPAIQGEVAALQVQLAAAKATGDAALATQIAEAIYAKENDVLEAQLAAQNAIKDNTDAMREQGGSAAFSYQSQTFTDLDAIRARVGA